MKTVIFCGGQGTRLREETEFRPKPLVEVGGRPILWHIMKHYQHFGFADFVLTLGYRGDMIKDYFLNFRAQTHDFSLRLGDHSSLKIYGDEGEDNFAVTCADTGLDTMTGGRLKRIRRYLNPSEFKRKVMDTLQPQTH